jgi:hypothetical protein
VIQRNYFAIVLYLTQRKYLPPEFIAHEAKNVCGTFFDNLTGAAEQVQID